VLKILSPEITHKTEAGGVRLDLKSPDEVEQAAARMLAAIGAARPDATLTGFMIQPMIRRGNAFELILGIISDSTFGPVVLFGAGGTGVEAINDTAMALTPLDLKLARDLIESTRIYRMLKGFRGQPAVDLEGLALCLVKLSSLAVQHPAIRSLDINPLVASPQSLLALDARIEVKDPAKVPVAPPAIRPYPIQWERHETLLNGHEIFIRPIRPDDEPSNAQMLTKVTPDDIRLRLLMPMREFSHQFLARMTQIDYAREMAFVAFETQPDGSVEMLGVVRFFADPDYEKAEYAVLVRSDLKGYGLGWVLMRHLIRYARAEGLKQLYGTVLKENATMLKMCQEMGFQLKTDPDDAMLYAVTLDIRGEKVTELLARQS
jgi:acetyltransferase